MANLGGNIFCNLGAVSNGDGSELSPFTPDQLSSALASADNLTSDCNVFLYGTKILSAGQHLDWSTPLLTLGTPTNKLTFKKKNTSEPCPVIYSSEGGHTARTLVKLGGGSFTTVFADVLVHVRGDLNATLEGLIEVVGSNEVIIVNDGLVGNNLSNFKVGGESCCDPEPPVSEDDSHLTFVTDALNFGTSDVKQIIRHGNFTIVATGDGSALKVYNTSNNESPVFVADVTLSLSNVRKFVLYSNTLFAMTDTEINSYNMFTIESGSNPSSDFTYTPAVGFTLMDMLYDGVNDCIYTTESDLSTFATPSITKRFNLAGGPSLGSLAWTANNLSRIKKLALTQNFLVCHIEVSSGVFNLATVHVNDGTQLTGAITCNDIFDMAGHHSGMYLYINQAGSFNVQVWQIVQDDGWMANTGTVITDEDFTDSSLIQVSGNGRSVFISGVHGFFLFSAAESSNIYLVDKYVTTNIQFIKALVDDSSAYVASKTLQRVFTFSYFTDPDGQAEEEEEGCCCCCGSENAGFLPVICNSNTKVYDNTWVIHAENAELLNSPTMDPFACFAANEVVLGNVAYTFLIPTDGTKVDANFFFKVADTAVSVIDIYGGAVTNPEGLADVGDFSEVHPFLNVTGNINTLDLDYGPEADEKGLGAIESPVDMDDNYPLFSTYGNGDAGYFCHQVTQTLTDGDVAVVIGGENVVLLNTIPDTERTRAYYTYIDESGNLNLAKRPVDSDDEDSTLGSDAAVN